MGNTSLCDILFGISGLIGVLTLLDIYVTAKPGEFSRTAQKNPREMSSIDITSREEILAELQKAKEEFQDEASEHADAEKTNNSRGKMFTLLAVALLAVEAFFLLAFPKAQEGFLSVSRHSLYGHKHYNDWISVIFFSFAGIFFPGAKIRDKAMLTIGIVIYMAGVYMRFGL